MFEGGFREFRSEGNILKTDDEKKMMAQKHRFKEHREFKKRLDGSDDDDMEEDDIRSFKFKTSPYASLMRERETASRRRTKFNDNEHDDRQDRKSYGRGDDRGRKSFGKGDRKPFTKGGGKPYGRNSDKPHGKNGGKPYGRKFNDD